MSLERNLKRKVINRKYFDGSCPVDSEVAKILQERALNRNKEATGVETSLGTIKELRKEVLHQKPELVKEL